MRIGNLELNELVSHKFSRYNALFRSRCKMVTNNKRSWLNPWRKCIRQKPDGSKWYCHDARNDSKLYYANAQAFFADDGGTLHCIHFSIFLWPKTIVLGAVSICRLGSAGAQLFWLFFALNAFWFKNSTHCVKSRPPIRYLITSRVRF